VRSKRAGERVLNSVRRFLAERLHLKVNESKSAVDRPWRRKFLGFSFYWRKGQVLVRVATQALERCRERLRQLTRRTRSGTLGEIIQAINEYALGWVGYFRLADTPSVFAELGEWLRRRLRQLLWKRWKRARARRRNLIALGVPSKTARETDGSGKGNWRLSMSPSVQQALNNAYWREQGLKSITEHYHPLRTT
jgi:hypothetical protein